MYAITSEILNNLPHDKKLTPNGWTSFKAPCCVHNGETPDKLKRGGIIVNGNGGISYHCFNCQYHTGWNPGRPLSYKMRNFMEWLGVDIGIIQRLVVDAFRVRDEEGITEVEKEEITVKFDKVELPGNAKSLMSPIAMAELVPRVSISNDIITYLKDIRGIPCEYFNDFYYSAAMHMRNKVIIPFWWMHNGVSNIVGYTIRGINDSVTPRYVKNSQPHYVYNLDEQSDEYKYVLVTEGPIDAMLINGVALLSNNITDIQAEIIESLGKEVVVVPDRSDSGQKLIDHALEYGWSVSFPGWGNPNEIEDVNDAVKAHGSIFTLKTILDNIESNPLKIKLRRKKFE